MLDIRKRMTLSFITVILFTVLVLEILIIDVVRKNYYKNLEDSLYNQIKFSCGLYEKYFADASLTDNVLNNVDSFWKQTNAQVEILDARGKVLMDSIGYMPEDDGVFPDVAEALEKGKGVWVGKVPYDNDPVMAVSSVLKVDGSVVGVLRFITSLRQVNNDIRSVSGIFIIVGVAVSAASVVLSLLLSASIIYPLKRVTRIAAKMAQGDFSVRGEKIFDDEIGKLSDTLNYMADEISKRDRLKNEFISSISHELRTPLTSIKGWAITLAESGLEDKEIFDTGLDIIEKESDRLTQMVEELLDFSRLATGKISIKKESFSLEELLCTVGRQMAPRATREGLVFNIEMGDDLPILYTDRNRLKQVIINILDNAFRFTPEGGKVVLRAEASGGEVVLTVTDTGCGIPEDELPNIKDKFYKGRNSKHGSGIGLSICDEIIKLMNGRLTIYSTVNKGTQVVIRIPVEENSEVLA